MLERWTALPSRLPALTVASLFSATARADSVFDVCKGESKTAVAGTGKMSIAVVYPEGFPATTTPVMRNAVGAVLARAEKAKIVPPRTSTPRPSWSAAASGPSKSDACGFAPSLVAVLGLKHPNLATATASVGCDDKQRCVLDIDLERHGRPTRSAGPATSRRWPGQGPDRHVHRGGRQARRRQAARTSHTGLAVGELAPGVVTVRSDVDGALEADRTMEGSSAFAACGPKGRKQHDIRGYWAEWTFSAKGTAFQTMVKPFAGADPADQVAAECLRKALEAQQIACPRDGKTIKVKTAICL